MFATTFGCTYLGTALFYVASSSSAPDVGAGRGANTSLMWLRVGGFLLLSVGLAVAAGTRPLGEGVLVWLSTAIAACSLLVVAAPLVKRFVMVSGVFAFLIAVGGLWV